MDFIKKHYEKILLGTTLLGLAGAVGFLFFKIDSEKEDLKAQAEAVTNPKVKPLPDIDLALAKAAIERVTSAVTVNFSEPHRLFNPVPWQKAPDGRLFKVDKSKIGPQAMVVTKITPLNLYLKLDSVDVESGAATFLISIQKEASASAGERLQHQKYCKVGDKNETFSFKEAQGPHDSPTNVVLELNDTGQRVVLAKDGPAYTRVDGYTADLAYPLEPNKKWSNCRVNRAPSVFNRSVSLSFNDDEYNIVAINQNEVVLFAKSNQKKWTIPYNPKP